MANLYGSNYTSAFVDKPAGMYQKGEKAGTKRLLFDSKLLSAAAGNGDVLYMGKLPANSIVTNAKLFCDKSLGATGTCTVGYLANGVDSADADAFIPTADLHTAAVLKNPDYTSVGIFKRFTAETDVVINFTAAMDGSVLTGTIYLEIEYVND